jgi:F-type H+-transporting ATPase subunit b
MSLLRVEPGLLIWLWITFVIVIVILRLTVWNRIVGGLDARAERIRSDLDGARKAGEDAHTLLEESTSRLEEGRQQAALVIEQARYQASVLREQLLSQVREDIEAERRKAAREIEQAREDAVRQLRTEVITLALEVARTVLKREVSTQDGTALVDEFLDTFPSRT